ncbi:hypothetical protein TWF694_009404 [Orbilia ellipsospora]|uniref:NAD(P)-binding protein n=1 Tax=Orbilia ellipsospora TaxID=2528407 RepID=A0AAV9XBS7_9PEZI
MPPLSGLLKFAATQYTALPLVPTNELCAGKTFIITGANTGLGYEAAKHLVQCSSSRVILTARSADKGKAALSRIEKETGKTGIAEYWNLDLASYESIKKFAKEVQALDRVDAIIENAGVALTEFTTAEGLETSLTVNVTGTYFLAVLLLPKLKETAKRFGIQPRITIVGSGVAFIIPGKLEAVESDYLEEMSTEASGMGMRYPASKLLQFYIFRTLAEQNRVEQTGVIINLVNPGMCYSELNRNMPLKMWIMSQTMRLFLARSTEVGSRTLLHGAFAGEESHGKYFSECVDKTDQLPDWVNNVSGKAIQKRVWDSLVKQLNIAQPGCI